MTQFDEDLAFEKKIYKKLISSAKSELSKFNGAIPKPADIEYPFEITNIVNSQ